MVQTRQMARIPADSSSDTEMETSPRLATITAPQIEENTHSLIALQATHHAEPTILPISQPTSTFDHLCTQPPSAVKIEELDFTYQQPPTAMLDAEIAHLHE